MLFFSVLLLKIFSVYIQCRRQLGLAKLSSKTFAHHSFNKLKVARVKLQPKKLRLKKKGGNVSIFNLVHVFIM